MDLGLVKDMIHNNLMQAHFTVSNVFFKDIFNFKLHYDLKETNISFKTVFMLPEKMKLAQKKVRLPIFKNELSKVMRAEAQMKMVEFISLESKKSGKLEEEKDFGGFFEEFNLQVTNEIGSNNIEISKLNINLRRDPNDIDTLIAPDSASFQFRTVDDTGLLFEEATIFRVTNDIEGFDQFRLKCTDGHRFIAKLLSIKVVREMWNPLFYILQELKVYNQQLYNKKHHSHILNLKDYFVTPSPTTHISSFCMIYEHYDFTLRDLLIHRKVKGQSDNGGGFTVRELSMIFKDVIQGLATLHKLGVTHRNLKPENIVYSSVRKNFMVANLSMALVFNKEDPVISSFDIVGTPFYMGLEIFADLSVHGGKLKFIYNPFKADVYSVGVIILECLWANIQLNDPGIPPLSTVFTQNELTTLDDFIELSELKHRQHQLFLSILRKKSGGLKKLPHFDMIKELLENMIFEDSSARFDIFQAKDLIVDIVNQIVLTEGETSESDLQELVGRMAEFHSKDCSSEASTSDDALILSVKNSQFLKDLNLSLKAERVDSALTTFWSMDRMRNYQTMYIEATVARIHNLMELREFDSTLKLIEEQLILCDLNPTDPEYNSLGIHSLVAKNKIMFIRSDIEEFFKTSARCDRLIRIPVITKHPQEMLIKLRLNYLELTMNYHLLNDRLCLSKINKFVAQIRVYFQMGSIEVSLVVGPFMMLTSLSPGDYESKIRILKEFEEKVSGNTKESQETLIQLSLFQVYYLSELGNNIEAYEYSKKIAKAVTGNFDDRLAYNMIAQMAFMLANHQRFYDSALMSPTFLANLFPKLMNEDIHTKTILNYFLKRLLIRYGETEELKNFMMLVIDSSRAALRSAI